MSFKLDSNNTGFKPLEKGEYEVFVQSVANEVSKAGNLMVQVNYIVRDDVEQAGKGQLIKFDNFVQTDAAMWRVNQASQAAGMDMDKEYKDIYEWGEDFKHRAVRVVVDHREWNGNVYPEVKQFLPSVYGGTYTPKEEDNSPLVSEGNPVDISDDDLPF